MPMILLKIIFGLFLLLVGELIAPSTMPSANATPIKTAGVTVYFNFYYRNIKVGNVTDTLLFNDNQQTYHLHSEVQAVGLAKILHGDIIVDSRGVVDAQYGLLITTYFEKRGRRDPKSVTKNIGSNQVTLSRKDETRQETIDLPLFDFATAVYRSYMLKKPMGGTMTITDGWRLRQYIYTIGKEQVVATDMGDISAIPLSANNPSRGERTLWLAPSLDYLPVRVDVKDKNNVFLLSAKKVVHPSSNINQNNHRSESGVIR